MQYEHRGANHLFERLLADPVLGVEMRDRYRTALEGPLERASVLALIDDLAARNDRSAQRDWSRWKTAYKNYGLWSDRTDWTDPDQEIAFLRSWTDARIDALATLLAE